MYVLNCKYISMLNSTKSKRFIYHKSVISIQIILESFFNHPNGVHLLSTFVFCDIPNFLNAEFLFVFRLVLSSSSSSGNRPITLTCHLSNSSQITSYEWLRVNYGPNGTQTVTSVQKTKSFRIQEVNGKDAGEWVCRYYGKQGVLGNVTYELHVMGR